jgi:manganese efflux pump family protein
MKRRRSLYARPEIIQGTAALITWIITALGGAVLLGTWLSRGGLRTRDSGASRFPPGLILGHFLLAATGLVIWIIYLITDADALTWVALAILVVVAALGFTMVGRWRARTGSRSLPAGPALPPALTLVAHQSSTSRSPWSTCTACWRSPPSSWSCSPPSALVPSHRLELSSQGAGGLPGDQLRVLWSAGEFRAAGDPGR